MFASAVSMGRFDIGFVVLSRPLRLKSDRVIPDQRIHRNIRRGIEVASSASYYLSFHSEAEARIGADILCFGRDLCLPWYFACISSLMS